MVPLIVRCYEDYLARESASWRNAAVLLTTEAPRGVIRSGHWEETLLAEATSGRGVRAVRIYALLQTALPRESEVVPVEDRAGVGKARGR
jgi:hypothetical protein